MMDPSKRDWRIGVRRLLTAPQDLAQSGARVWIPSAQVSGSSKHRQLFEKYRTEVGQVVQLASEWWNDMLRVQEELLDDHEQAIRTVWETRPAGPASHPECVRVIRKYWLACDALNQEVPEQEAVPPEVFLLSWLADVNEEEVLKVLSGMPYWPIGLDGEGNWV